MANDEADFARRAKIKTKESINKLKHRSPTLQELLRERCKARMREQRNALFNVRRLRLQRTGDKDVGNVLAEIVRQEFTMLTTDVQNESDSIWIKVHEVVDVDEALDFENEIIAEQEQWILEDYEKMAKDELDVLTLALDQSDGQVICPICQKSNLTERTDCITCERCDCKINTCNNVKEFGQVLDQLVKLHSNSCKETPNFTLIPENTKVCLYLVCQTCSSLLPVV